jgi:hypothetical protein
VIFPFGDNIDDAVNIKRAFNYRRWGDRGCGRTPRPPSELRGIGVLGLPANSVVWIQAGNDEEAFAFNPETMETFSTHGNDPMTIVKEKSPTSIEVDQNLPPQVISAFFGAQLTTRWP